MDDIGIATLWREMREDCRIVREALRTAKERFGESSPSGFDSCGHHLCRVFNAMEQLALRVARAFENHVSGDSGWHAELARRMALDIGGVRPALFPPDFAAPLRELRGFRHLFTHAYDLTLDPARMGLLLRDAEAIAPHVEHACARFIREAASMHGLRSPVE
jgi:hypothetical protein